MSIHFLQEATITDKYSLLRFIILFGLGLLIAGGLTFFMHVLIESSQKELDQTGRANLLDFVRVKRDEASQKKDVKPKRPELEKPPEAPKTPEANDSDLSDNSLAVEAPTIASDVAVDISGIGLDESDGEYLPIVKIAPVYPFAAMGKGLEGHCTVQYTVTTNGSTKDISTVPGECPGVFAQASIKAAKKFKYKPRVVDGVAIEVPNVRNRFNYTLHKAENQ